MTMGSFTSPLTLTTHAVAYPLAVRGTGDDTIPSLHFHNCASLTIEIISVGGVSIVTTPSAAVVYFAGPPPLGASSGVSSSAFNLKLDGTTNTSASFGLGGDECNDIDLSLCYVTSDTDAVVVSISARQV